MQCPNCRKIEKGQWLYANGSHPLPEFNMDDWAYDEDLYDLGYSEMSFGVQWCPFSGLTRIPASFDEGEFSSSASHPCPYITYFGPVHQSSTSSGSVSDGSSFNNHWSGLSVQSDVPSSYGFPSMDAHYHGWAHSPPFATGNLAGAADQPSIPSVNQRAARNGSDAPRPGMHPFVVGHSSGRAPSSVTTSVLTPYPGIVVRPRDRAPSLQAYFPQSNNAPMARTPLVSTGRRSSSRGGLAQVVPLNSSSDQSSGFYLFSSNSSGRSFQEPENTRQDQFHAWDQDYQPSLPLNPVDRDSIWGPFHPPTGVFETGMRSSSFRHRHGSERTPQNRPWVSYFVKWKTVIAMTEIHYACLSSILQGLESAKHGRAETVVWLRAYCVPFLFSSHEMCGGSLLSHLSPSPMGDQARHLNRNSRILKDFHHVGIPCNILICLGCLIITICRVLFWWNGLHDAMC